MKADIPDVEDAIIAVLGGDSDRFSEVVSVYQRIVWQTVLSVIWNRDIVQDVVQNVFVKIYFSLGDYRQGTSFKAWIQTVARNTAINEVRGLCRRKKHLEAFRGLWEEAVGGEGSAAEQFSMEARKEKLAWCREKLPERQRMMINMRYSEGMSLEQIAKVVGRSAEAVKQAIWRIQLALRDCVQKAGEA